MVTCKGRAEEAAVLDDVEGEETSREEDAFFMVLLLFARTKCMLMKDLSRDSGKKTLKGM